MTLAREILHEHPVAIEEDGAEYLRGRVSRLLRGPALITVHGVVGAYE